MMFWAHSGPSADRSDWQTLPDHSAAVSRLAGTMGDRIRLGRSAALAGLLHDLGKYDPAFDRVLQGEKVLVDHSTAGAAVLTSEAGSADRLAAELIAYAILGHHAGLPDRRASDASLEARIKRFEDRLDPTWRANVPIDLSGVLDEVRVHVRHDRAGFDLSVVVRMLFSCLVDADFKDTEAHYARIEGREVDRAWPRLQDRLPHLIARFDAHMADKAGGAAATELNALRRDILEHVRGKTVMSPGLFTLTVPTGGGKTLASLGFALDHARAHGHGRIIYAIPFTSIIDQTAAVFREVLGDGVVLEHHSAIDEEGGALEGRDKLRLAMEDWAAPVVVTTNVQLFESLFAARTSRARKLHNVAGSVIVLDEAQTIPRPLLLPCVRMLDALAENWGCTIVLCTATQPAMGKGTRGLKAEGLPLTEERELAPDPHGLARKLRRAMIRWGGAMDDEALVAALRPVPQALMIVNSRGHALDLFRAAKADGLEGLIHLTTRRCAADRQGVLAEVKRRLDPKVGEPCRVIATSLIEAGVDVDFPAAWRARAGLDQVVQAAGRCNREGLRPAEDSIVTVFEAPDHPTPWEVAALVKDAERMLEEHRDDLLSLDAIEAYFGEVYWRLGKRLDGKDVLPRLTMLRATTDFAFRSIAEDFSMIESGMAPVIVPFDDAARRAVEELAIPGIPSGRLARVLQPYVVQVPPKARARLIANGRVAFLSPRLRGDQFAVLTDMTLYGKETGLMWEDADYLATERLMI